MNATDKNMPMNTALTIAAVIGVVAFLLLMIVGGFGFFGALFLGLLVGIAAFVGLVIWFVGAPGAELTAASGGAPIARESTTPKAQGASVAATASSTSATADATKPGSGTAAGDKPAKPKAKPAKTKPAKAAAAGGAKPAKAAKPAAKPAKAAEPAAGAGAKPAVLSAARATGADNLKEIKGVGPKMEVMLNEMGFYHFDQVAGWSGAEVSWVDQNLKGFKGRVSRDNWVEQAKILASGGETEFSKKVDKGGVN